MLPVTQIKAIWEDIDETEMYTEQNFTVFHLQREPK